MTNILIKSHDGKVQKGLLFSGEQWQGLHYKINKAGLEAKLAAEKIQDLENRKKMSREMTKEWENTIIKMRKKRFEQRHERMLQIQKKLEQRIEEMRNEEEKIREEATKKAAKELYEQKDSSKSLAQALRLAEVLKVRSEQIEFEKKLNETEEKRKRNYEQSIVDDVNKYRQEEEQKSKLLREKKIKMKEEALKEFKERQERRNKENEELMLEERNYLMKSQDEIALINEHEQLKKEERRRNMWNDIFENKKRVKEQTLLKAEESEEEKLAIHLISEAKKRMAMIRQRKELELQAAATARRDKIIKGLSAIAEDKDARDEESLQRAKNEKNEQDVNRAKREKEMKEKLAKEKKEAYEEFRVEEERRKDKEREIFKWEFMNKHKAEEVDKEFRKIALRKKIQQMNSNKEAWKKQIEEKRKIENTEKQKEENELMQQFEQWNIDDKEFFEYADQTAEDCKKYGRPLYPLEKCIQEYKKKNGLMPKKLPHHLFTSNVPVAHSEQKETRLEECLPTMKTTEQQNVKFIEELLKKKEEKAKRLNGLDEQSSVGKVGKPFFERNGTKGRINSQTRNGLQ